MHEIITAITIATEQVVETCEFDFDTQEDVIDFLDDFMSFEASRLYDELRKRGDRTTVIIDPCHRKAMRRTVSGTSRSDGRDPVEGTIEVTVRRVA